MSENHDDSINDDSEVPVDDIELAYQQALQAIDSAEVEVGLALSELADDGAENPDADDGPSLSIGGDAFASDGQESEDGTESTLPQSDDGTDEERIRPWQIIESALFVGGTPLTARKLATLLRGEFEPDFVERTIDELNRRYEEQNRPYVIELREGGYELRLKSEYVPLQHRLFNIGPREVRLSQDALEILSLVAYSQPIRKADIEQTGRKNGMTVLRQLVRRQLVAVERDESAPRDPRYVTSPRFLEVFGLKDISELPQAELLDLK